MIITCIGPSGSGKSTVINHLKDWEYFKGKKVFIKKEDDFQIVKLFKFILGDKVFSDYKEQKFFHKKSNSLNSIIFSWIVYWFYPLIIYLEFLWTHFWYSIIWQDRILLSDRYIYDYLVTFEEVLDIHNPIIRLLIFIFPKPDLSFYLSISKDTSLARNKNNIKGKITTFVSLHENVLEKYDHLVARLGIIAIKNDNNISDSLKEIKYYIFAKEKLSSIKSLSISGMDGSGKTTICNDLNNLCSELHVKSCIVGLYHLPILYKILTKLNFKYQNSKKTPKIEDKRSFFWGLLNFTDSLMQYFLTRSINFNSLIIYDRYFYDYLTSFKYRGVPHLGMFPNLIPKVNKSFLFIIDPDEAFKRSGDNLTKDYFQMMHKYYIELAEEQKPKLIHINNKNPREILSEVIQSI